MGLFRLSDINRYCGQRDSQGTPHNSGIGQAKVHKVLHEFKEGKLHSSSGAKVKKRSQAIAIAMSEAGLSKKG